MTAHDFELIERAAELLKISDLLNRDIMTLSDGERQLVFIAAAVAQDTKIILLDEPTASLDPDKAAQVFGVNLRPPVAFQKAASGRVGDFPQIGVHPAVKRNVA